MSKFEVIQKTFRCGGNYCIVEIGTCNYMHRDGEVVPDCTERWPTEEQAQAVLDKFQPPLPLRVWEHGDVFQNCVGTWIYLIWNDEPHVLDLNMSQAEGTLEVQLRGDDVEFLFNIRNILSDRGLA